MFLDHLAEGPGAGPCESKMNLFDCCSQECPLGKRGYVKQIRTSAPEGNPSGTLLISYNGMFLG